MSTDMTRRAVLACTPAAIAATAYPAGSASIT
jgi:hypothetical protein